MPLSTLYKVVARYTADTTGAEGKVDRLSKKAERHARKVEKARSAWQSFGSAVKVAIAGGAVFGLGLLTRRMIKLTRRAQDARIQIAAVFEQASPGNFAKNLDRASNLFQRFQKSAITSPATSEEFLQLFTGAAPGLAPLGLSNKVIDRFIARAVPTAVAFTGGDFEQAGRDILQILQGRAGTDVKTFNSLKAQLFKLTGTKDTESFNKLAQEAPNRVFEALNKTLESMDVVNQEFANSFGGLLASVTEFADRFLRTIGGPVVAEMSRQLQRMTQWFSENEDSIRQLGEDLGEKVATGLRVAVKLSGMLLENFRGILVVGTAIAAKRAFGLAAALGGGVSLQGLGANIGAARRISGGIGRAPGRIALGAADIVGEVLFGGMFGPRQDRFSKAGRRLKAAGHRQIMGQGVTFETLNKGAASIKAAGMAALAKGLPAIGAAFGTMLTFVLPLSVIIGMLAGTFRVLKDESNEATIFFRTSIEELMTQLDRIAIQFGASGGFVKALTDIVDWLGTGVVGVLGIGVKIVERLANAFSFLFAVMKGFALGVGTIFSRLQEQGLRAAFDPGFVRKAFSSGMATAFEERRQAEIKAMKDRERRRKEEEKKKDEKGVAAGGAKPPQVNVTVHQTITTDANPDRIAFRVGEVIGDVARKFPRAVPGVRAA